MTPIFQTIYGNGKGNCFAACIASIFEVPVESVPNFCGDHGDDWYLVASEYCRRTFGHAPLYFNDDPHMRKLIADMGCYTVVSGKSPRGDFLHSVIYRDGELVHDPHLSGAGLASEPGDWIVFVALDPGKKGC